MKLKRTTGWAVVDEEGNIVPHREADLSPLGIYTKEVDAKVQSVNDGETVQQVEIRAVKKERKKHD